MSLPRSTRRAHHDDDMPSSPPVSTARPARVAIPPRLVRYAPGPLAMLAHAGGVPVPISASVWADALALVRAASAGPSSADALAAHTWWLTLVAAAQGTAAPQESAALNLDDTTSTQPGGFAHSRRSPFTHAPRLPSLPTHARVMPPAHTPFDGPARPSAPPRRQTSNDNAGAPRMSSSSAAPAPAAWGANRRHLTHTDFASPIAPSYPIHSGVTPMPSHSPIRGPTAALNTLASPIPTVPAIGDESRDQMGSTTPAGQLAPTASSVSAASPSAEKTDPAIADIIDELDLHRQLLADSATELARLHPRADARAANKRRQYLSLPLLEVVNDSGAAPWRTLPPIRSRRDISLLSRAQLAEWIAFYNGFCPPASIEGMQRALCACVGVKYGFGGIGCVQDDDGGWKAPAPAVEAAFVEQEEGEEDEEEYDECDDGYGFESDESIDDLGPMEPHEVDFEYDPTWPTVKSGETGEYASDVDADDGGWGQTVTPNLYVDEVIKTPNEAGTSSARTGAAALDHAAAALGKGVVPTSRCPSGDDSDSEWVDAADDAEVLAS